MVMALSKDKKYTYKDYLTWNDEEKWELIDGYVYDMTPGPSRKHQEISANLLSDLLAYFRGKPCKVFHAPFDVRLSFGENEENIKNVVQPDIIIVCDKNKLDDRGCLGSPDLVIEIISASTAKKDLNEKFNLYEKACIEQYWVVYPYEKELFIYCLVNGKYDDGTKYKVEQTITSEKFAGLTISLKDIFSE